MTKLVITLPEALAGLVLDRQRAHGYPTADAAAAALISEGLIAGKQEDHSAGHTDEALRTLLDEAEASGPAEAWDASAVRAEVLRRYAARTAA